MSEITRQDLVEGARNDLKAHSRETIFNTLVNIFGQTPEEAESILIEASPPEAAPEIVAVPEPAPKVEQEDEKPEKAESINRESVDFFDSEISRLSELFEQRIAKFKNVENVICCTKPEYIEALAVGTMEINEEEWSGTMMEIGTKVVRKNANTIGVIVQYGIVVNNHILYEVEQDPFEGMAAEVEKTFIGGVQTETEIHHPETFTEEQQAVRKALATAVFVEWCDKNGNVICRGWHHPDQLEKIEEV